jgi:Ni,Fe-hydrogenase III small subunit
VFVLVHRLQRLRRELDLSAPARAGSLALRHVDAGSCNGCEHELTAASSPVYDLQRFGLNVVASPRHADVLLVTGAVTARMAEPLLAAYHAMPEPRLVAALGDCALGCGILADPGELAGPLDAIVPVDLQISGCPPTPAQIADALTGALDLLRPRASRPGRRRQ